VRRAINDEAITEVKDSATVIPPSATAADPIRGVDTDGSLL
jgi:hypothetical protein